MINDPPGKDPDDEKIVLCNAGPGPAKIGNWRLRDNSGGYSIPEGTTIPPGGRWEIFGTTFNPAASPSGIFLNNKSDCVLLFDADENLMAKRMWPQ